MLFEQPDTRMCHIYNRGVEKRTIFIDTNDYLRFQENLDRFNTLTPAQLQKATKEGQIASKLVSIHAFCMMPNHYHLLLTEEIEQGISLFMHRIGTGYSKFFNIKYDRTGTLFESKYKFTEVTTQNQAEQTERYIHLNPLSLAGIQWKEQEINNLELAEKQLTSYTWSSLWTTYNQINQFTSPLHQFSNLQTHIDYIIRLPKPDIGSLTSKIRR
jgi:putative transposase